MFTEISQDDQSIVRFIDTSHTFLKQKVCESWFADENIILLVLNQFGKKDLSLRAKSSLYTFKILLFNRHQEFIQSKMLLLQSLVQSSLKDCYDFVLNDQYSMSQNYPLLNLYEVFDKLVNKIREKPNTKGDEQSVILKFIKSILELLSSKLSIIEIYNKTPPPKIEYTDNLLLFGQNKPINISKKHPPYDRNNYCLCQISTFLTEVDIQNFFKYSLVLLSMLKNHLEKNYEMQHLYHRVFCNVFSEYVEKQVKSVVKKAYQIRKKSNITYFFLYTKSCTVSFLMTFLQIYSAYL